MNKNSKTNLGRFDALTDEMIDTSDIPALTSGFFESAKWRMPKNKVRVVLELEPDIARWYEAQGERYQEFLTAALRTYAKEHKQ